jgi:isopenicillin N synthase-like dioxygenase
MSTSALAESRDMSDKGIDPNNIPVIDLGAYLAGEPGSLERVAAELKTASETVGFHYIANHGIEQALIDETFHQAARYHALPLEEKMKMPINEDLHGYMPLKGATVRVSDELATGNLPDQNEAVFIFRDSLRWPENLPGFKEVAMAYFYALEDLSLKMLPLYAVALEQAPDFFAPAFTAPWAGLRLSHYPKREYAKNEYGIAPHSDTSFFTLLAQNRTAGLQIKTRGGSWVDAPVVDGTIVVNSGNVLNRWTNGRFLSTPHRAYNHGTGSRYATPFFFHPDKDYRMSCIPSCTGPGNPPRFPEETVTDYMAWWNKHYFAHIE